MHFSLNTISSIASLLLAFSSLFYHSVLPHARNLNKLGAFRAQNLPYWRPSPHSALRDATNTNWPPMKPSYLISSYMQQHQGLSTSDRSWLACRWSFMTDAFDATTRRTLLRWSSTTINETSIPCLTGPPDRKNKDVSQEPATSATDAVYGAGQLKAMAIDARTAQTLASTALSFGPWREEELNLTQGLILSIMTPPQASMQTPYYIQRIRKSTNESHPMARPTRAQNLGWRLSSQSTWVKIIRRWFLTISQRFKTLSRSTLKLYIQCEWCWALYMRCLRLASWQCRHIFQVDLPYRSPSHLRGQILWWKMSN